MNMNEQLSRWYHAGEYAKTIREVEKVPRKQRTYRQTMYLVKAINNLAIRSMEQDAMLKRALTLLDDVRRRGESDGEWWFCRGFAYYWLGEMEKARVSMERASSLLRDPTYARKFLKDIAREGAVYHSQVLSGILRTFPGEPRELTAAVEQGAGRREYFVFEAGEGCPWETVVSRGVSDLSLTPERLESLQVELLLRIPPGNAPMKKQKQDGGEHIYATSARVMTLAWEILNSGRMLPQPGSLFMFLDAPGPYGALMLIPAREWVRNGGRFTTRDGREIRFLEVLPLYHEEAAYCSTDERIGEVLQRLMAVPIPGDPARPPVCSSPMSGSEETPLAERSLQLREENRFREVRQMLEQVPKEKLTLILKVELVHAVAMETREADPEKQEEQEKLMQRGLELALSMRKLAQAVRLWYEWTGSLLRRLGRYEEALEYLEPLEKAGVAWEKTARLIRLCRDRRKEDRYGGSRTEEIQDWIGRQFGEEFHELEGNRDAGILEPDSGRWGCLLVTAGLSRWGTDDPGEERMELVLRVPRGTHEETQQWQNLLLRVCSRLLEEPALKPGGMLEGGETWPCRGVRIGELEEDLKGLSTMTAENGDRVAFRQLEILDDEAWENLAEPPEAPAAPKQPESKAGPRRSVRHGKKSQGSPRKRKKKR